MFKAILADMYTACVDGETRDGSKDHFDGWVDLEYNDDQNCYIGTGNLYNRENWHLSKEIKPDICDLYYLV